MNRREIAFISCKILALWAFGQAALTGTGATIGIVGAVIQHLRARPAYSSFGTPRDNSDVLLALVMALPGLVMLCFGLILWFRADAIALRMMGPRNDRTETSGTSVTRQSALMIAMAAVGIIVFSEGLRLTINSIAWGLKNKNELGHWSASSNLAGDIAEMVIGLWLVFTPRALARLVTWIRTAGIADEPSPVAPGGFEVQPLPPPVPPEPGQK